MTKEFKLHLEEKLLERVRQKAAEVGLSANQLIVDILAETLGGEKEFDYAAALGKIVDELEKRPPGEFILAELNSFSHIGVVTAESGHLQPATVRAGLGKAFNRAVEAGKVPGVTRATIVRDGVTELKLIARTAVYTKEEI